MDDSSMKICKMRNWFLQEVYFGTTVFKKQSWSLRRFPSIQSQGNIVKSPHDQDHTTGKKQLWLAILPWVTRNLLGARLATSRNTVLKNKSFFITWVTDLLKRELVSFCLFYFVGVYFGYLVLLVVFGLLEAGMRRNNIIIEVFSISDQYIYNCIKNI